MQLPLHATRSAQASLFIFLFALYLYPYTLFDITHHPNINGTSTCLFEIRLF